MPLGAEGFVMPEVGDGELVFSCSEGMRKLPLARWHGGIARASDRAGRRSSRLKRTELGVGQSLCHQPRRIAGVAGRVAGVDVDELLEQCVELFVWVRRCGEATNGSRKATVASRR